MRHTALLLLLASALLSATADTYYDVTLSDRIPVSDQMLDAYGSVHVHVAGREFTVSVVDVSDTSASFAIYEGTTKVCGQYDPNCIVRLGEENQALAAATGFYITLNDKPSSLFMQVRVSFKIPGSACELILGNADETKAVNVLFVPDDFKKTDAELFTTTAKRAAEALLAVEPFKSNAAKFNFYVAGFALGKTFDFKKYWWDPAVDEATRSCRRTVTVAFSKYYFFDESAGSAAYAENIDYLAISQRGHVRLPSVPFWKSEEGTADPYFEGLGEKLFPHEFGHAFAKLADEYFFETQFAEYSANRESSYYDYGRLSNIGGIGCPKWCSGEVGGSEECKYWWNRLAECEGSGGYDCIKKVVAEKSDATDFVLSCDFGKGCESGTGCYAGGGYRYVSLFKPVAEGGCMMSGGSSFCPVCERELEHTLEQYG